MAIYGNIVGAGGKTPQTDWLQTDDTKTSYLKNKPSIKSGKGNSSIVEGDVFNTFANGDYAHAEGEYSSAGGYASHAEGTSSADGSHAHSEGQQTVAQGDASHTEGMGTVADSNYQHAQGKYNIPDADGKYAHIVGNGNSETPANAHTLDWDGNAWFAGKVKIGGSGQDDDATKTLATTKDIATALDNYATAERVTEVENQVAEAKKSAEDAAKKSFNGVITSESEFDTATTHGVYMIKFYNPSAPSDREDVSEYLGVYNDGILTVKRYWGYLSGAVEAEFCEQWKFLSDGILHRLGTSTDFGMSYIWEGWTEPYKNLDVPAFDGVIASEAELDNATEHGVYKVNLYTANELVNEYYCYVDIYEDAILLVKTCDEQELLYGGVEANVCNQTLITATTIRTRQGYKLLLDAEPSWSWSEWTEPYATAETVGDIEAALDSILAIQEGLVGGENA